MNSRSRKAKVIVAGGSLGGLFAANLLHRAGHDVHVYERVTDELEGRGAGIVTQPELLEALVRIDVPVDGRLGIEISRRVTLDRSGKPIAARAFPQIVTAWSRLFRLLRSAFPNDRYHNGFTLIAVKQDMHGTTACFADGRMVTADLLVAADGLRSMVRQDLLPEVKYEYAGYVAWRGIVDEALLSQRVLSELFPYFGFCLPPHEQMLGYPIPGAHDDLRPGRRRYNFVWYRPVEETKELKEVLTDGTGKFWPDGIPPPLVRSALLEEIRADAQRTLAPQFVEVVAKTRQLFVQPIFDLASPRLAFGRVALLGDAGFVARPHCGMGVTKAAADAMKLVDALSENDDIVAALLAYDAPRVDAGRFIVGHARALGAYMQAQLRSPEERAMAERFRSPQAVMDETAVAPRMA